MKKIVIVLALLAIAASANAAELLTNGGFNGSLNGWTGYSEAWPAIPSPDYMTGGSVWGPSPAPLEGSGMAGKGYGGNIGGGNAALYQTINVAAGIPIDISGYVAGGVGGFGNFNGVAWWEVRINEGGWANPDAGALLWKREANSEGSNFNWDHVAASYTPETSQVTLFVKYGAWDPQWDYMYFGAYFDQFSATQVVPEPGSMLALASGLLGLVGVIRRRK